MTIDLSFLNSLDKFHLAINKRIASRYTGSRKSIFIGRGGLVADHRMYVPGDDFRSIDWNIYARTEKLHVKTYEEEKSLSVHILMDSSASMKYGKGAQNKFEYASMIGVGVAYMAMKENEKFQFCTFDDKLELFKSFRGRSQLASMIDHLNKVDNKGHSYFEDALSKYSKLLKSRSYVVIISDFLFDIEEIKRALYYLGKNHDVRLIQVLDKDERDIPFEGDTKLFDLESGGLLRTFITPRLKTDYESQLKNHNDQIEKICLSQGMKFYTIYNDMPIFESF